MTDFATPVAVVSSEKECEGSFAPLAIGHIPLRHHNWSLGSKHTLCIDCVCA